MILVILLAWLYTSLGNLPQVDWMLYGVQPVVIAIILQAMIRLGRTAYKNLVTLIAAAIAPVLYFMNFPPLLALICACAGVIVPAANLVKGSNHIVSITELPLFDQGRPFTGSAQPINLATLFLTSLKIGSVLYGSGYVLLAFLQSDFIEGLGLLTEQQLLEAVAVGRFTPGPVFTTATFIGYIVAGLPGAIVAPFGIFLPSLSSSLSATPSSRKSAA